MKLIHLSDLHIGKRVNEFSMIEDQKYILNQILEIIRKEEPDAVLIAGDIYDKSVPSAEAVEVFDDFLVSLAEAELGGAPVLWRKNSRKKPDSRFAGLSWGNRAGYFAGFLGTGPRFYAALCKAVPGTGVFSGSGD